jgi:hypothetical protein
MDEELEFSNTYDDGKMHVIHLGDGIFAIEIWLVNTWNTFHLEGDDINKLIEFLQKNIVGTKESE